MRFRKTVSICKGVKLNLSTSGVSCTVGGKGVSLNLGKKGVFLNTSLPGTGISDRRKLFGGTSASKRKEKEKAKAKQDKQEVNVLDYALEVKENGAIEIIRKDGKRTTESEERALRRTDWYDDESRELAAQFLEKMNAGNDAFLTLQKFAKSVPALGEIEDEECIDEAMHDLLDDLELPVEFDVQYEYNPATGHMMVDLDVPEIEDLPEEKAVELASGAVKAKAKSQKELKDEYRTCVLGLAVFFASHIFLCSEGLSAVTISGYTQRRNKSTGEREDCYIYSIVFERDGFKTDRCATEDPADFCDRFRSRINVMASGEMKQIVPYTPEEVEAMLA